LKTNTTINCPIEGLRDKVEEIWSLTERSRAGKRERKDSAYLNW
jgi:hypothetical protein